MIGVSSQPLLLVWSFEETTTRQDTARNGIASYSMGQDHLDIIERTTKRGIKSLYNKACNLQGVECGEVLDTFPVDALAGGGFELLANTILADVPDTVRAKFIADFGTKINYGVQIKNLCASCDTAVALSGSNDFYLNPGFNKYCGEGVYGHDMIHSGLVTYPLAGSSTDPTSIKIKPGTLPYYIYSRPTKTSSLEGPSSEWKADFDTVYGFFASMVLGTVGVSPDFMGYGSSASVKSYNI